MNAACRIEMLGALRAEQDGRSITRFRTQKTAVLLAYLAFYRDRPHPREALTELLWPECEAEAGRNSLSKALGSLRNQLEPPGVPSGAVFLADRYSVQLNSANCTTDVAAFLAAVQSTRSPGWTSEEAITRLTAAADLYGGDLLPGFYEDWNVSERASLAETYSAILHQLVALLERAGDFRRAREYARRGVAADPLREEAHQSVILLCLASGDPAGAVRQYREWERLSQKELGLAPSPELQALVTQWRDTGTAVEAPLPAPSAASVRVQGSLSAAPAVIPLLGTVTVLLGDRAGAGQEFARLVARHGGAILAVDEGPGAVFGRATEAVACAVAFQRQSAEMDPAPRLSLQTGELPPDSGENAPDTRLDRLRADGARLLTAAQPGRILCGEATAVFLRRDPEPGAQMVDLGLYRLPGGPDAERLFDVLYPGRPMTIPSVPDAPTVSRAALPLQLTRFFGRDGELAGLLEKIDEARRGEGERLWTLTGPGGMGKTRLSLEVARQSMTAFDGAVWFVPLAEISDPALIINAVSETLQVFRAPALDPLSRIAQALADRPAFIVLDNFEQFVGPTADLRAVDVVMDLLARVPTLTCLVTSRHRLGVIGEREFPLSPLPIPEGASVPEVLAGYDSVRLFVDRAQTVRPDFQVTPGNAAAVAALCERLEGLPLAIELAAARAQVLTPAQMLRQLERRFDFLVSRQRNFALRHRTIRAAIDWSYALLTPELRGFVGLLSVFRGGWTLDAAEAVTGEPLALDHLEQLVDCSLVLTDSDALGEMRYRQLETLRQYAEETLPQAEQAALKGRHLAFFRALAEEAGPHLQGPQQGEWLVRLEAEHDNFRAALQTCLETPAWVEDGLRTASALWRFWQVRGYLSEGRDRLGRLLARAPEAGVSAEILGKARITAGILARYQNDHEAARALLLPCLAPARAAGDTVGLALALFHLGHLDLVQNHWADARARLEESLSLSRMSGDRAGIAAALTSLGIVESEAGEFRAAQSLFAEALELRRALGDKQGIATLLSNIGNVSLLQGDYLQAKALFEDSLILRRELGDKWGIASLLNSLGLQLSNQQDYHAARPLLEESVSLFRDVGDRQGIAISLCNLGTVALLTNDPQARELLSESLILRWNVGDKLGVAFSLEALARLETARGDTTRAVTLWAVTEALREGIQAPLPPSSRATVEGAVAAARQALAADTFAAAWAHGRSLELEQVLALVLDDASP